MSREKPELHISQKHKPLSGGSGGAGIPQQENGLEGGGEIRTFETGLGLGFIGHRDGRKRSVPASNANELKERTMRKHHRGKKKNRKRVNFLGTKATPVMISFDLERRV